MTNPFYDPYRVLTKIYAEGAHLKLALSGTDIEELNRARTVRTVYGVLEHDAYLSLCIRTFAARQPKQAVRILMKIALYWLIFLEKPRYMVTDTAVSLLKKLGKGGMAGFVNAFLRAFDLSQVQLPAGEEGLAVRSNYPLYALRRMRAQYGDRTEEIALARSHGVSVRFVRGAMHYLDRPHEDTPFENVYIFPHFVRDERFFAGDYTFQSVGSVAICSLMPDCERLLDACAAPGGKSVLLAARCQSVTACELHEHRAALIRGYCSRMGCDNVTCVVCDSAQPCAEWLGQFDGVLCDVPCSGLGTLAENPDIALRCSEAQLAALAPVQRGILKNCADYVRAGGTLIYSTCSLLQEENDAVVADFLRENSGFSVVAAECPLPHVRTDFGLQFLPDRAFGAGFYAAVLRRGS